ncbi:MAG: peptidoglycan DD-metalloendopeptidase family protein [Persicimonas sp.]
MSTLRRITTYTLAIGFGVLAAPATADAFDYNPPGELVSGSGQGRTDNTVYVPDMRFPIEEAPAFANSQVWGHGGSQGPGGGQCDDANYSYPWWDNYCETREWDVPLCPGGTGHQGQDIRPSTCEDNVHWAVAAEAGQISNIGSYSVYLQADNGTRHRYLHMDPASIPVSEGQRVAKGDRLGRVSNAFGGTPTTIHLHYDLYQNVSGVGNTYVPTYMSLVDSYERLLGIPQEPCEVLGADGGTLDDSGPCFQLHGPPDSWRYVSDAGHEGDLHWTYAWDDAEESNWAQWHVELSEAGTYRVEAFVVSDYAQAQQARYEIHHAGQTTEARLDYTAGDGWRSLGEFDFAAGAEQWVANYDNTGESLDDQRRIIADAVRLTRIRPDEPEPDAGTPEEDAGGGDDVGSGEDVGGGDSGSDDAGTDVSNGGSDTEQRQGSSSATTTSSCSSAGGNGPVGLVWWGVVVLFGWRRLWS